MQNQQNQPETQNQETQENQIQENQTQQNQSTRQRQLVILGLQWKIREIPDNITVLHNLPKLIDEYNLCSVLGYSGKFPWHAAKFTNEYYYKFWIDKDTNLVLNEFDPTKNLREINAPRDSLKSLQKRLVTNIFNKLPKHTANYAYMTGRTIKDACEQQQDGDVTIAIDLKQFFESHKINYIKKQLMKVTGYSNDVCYFMAKLCCLNNCMPQGSSASPVLSIVLNHDMDVRIAEVAAEHNLVYTRYADDMQFSGSDRDNKWCWKFIEELMPLIKPFKINWKKVRIMRNRCTTIPCGWTVSGTDNLVETVARLSIPADFIIKMHPSGTKCDIRLRSAKDINIGKLDDYTEFKDYLDGVEGLVSIPLNWYVQGTRKMLGLHLIDGVRYPRKKYRDLRLQALLYARGVHPHPSKFKGILSYIRLVDNHKYNQLLAITQVTQSSDNNAIQNTTEENGGN